MGIGVEAIDIISQLRTEGHLPRKARVVEIGAQQLATSFLDAGDKLTAVGQLFGVEGDAPFQSSGPGHIVHGQMEHLERDAPPALAFWRWLDMEYAAIDIDETPGAIPLDLNTDSVPEESVGKFDLVTNFGTTEHVANQVNAFKIIHDLTAMNGLMLHSLPAQGMMNHGLINYNFKFFWMLARSNGYQFLFADYRQARNGYTLPDNIIDFVNTYNPEDLSGLAGLSVADGGLTVVMKKQYDIPYVPPLDIPTGTPTTHKALAERYWTVFDPDAFDRLETEKRAAQAAEQSEG